MQLVLGMYIFEFTKGFFNKLYHNKNFNMKTTNRSHPQNYNNYLR